MPEYLIKIMSIPTENKRNSIPTRVTEYMCVCNRRPVCLYNIPYIKCGEIRLTTISRFQTCLALYRCNVRKTIDKLNSKTRKKQDSIPKQCSDTNKKDNKQTNSLFACFRAANSVLTAIQRIALQSIESQTSIAESRFDEIIKHVRAQTLSKAACLHLSRVLGAE